MGGNKAVLFELETPRGKLRMGVVLQGSFAEEALTFVDSLCVVFGLPPAEWGEAEHGVAWSYRDQARGLRAEVRVLGWGLRKEP